MSLRGRVLRRKYPAWTVYPKSIQEQRVQLAALLEAFHYFPVAGLRGPMTAVREALKSVGLFMGTFPYPTIYPSSFDTGLPLTTTQWARFGPNWHYSGQAVRSTSIPYAIGFIVVDVTTDPKQPRIKCSAKIDVNAGSGACLETVVPAQNGAWLCYASDPGGVSALWNVQTATFNDNDEFYVAMAFNQEPIPVTNTMCALSYYVLPSAVLQPNMG